MVSGFNMLHINIVAEAPDVVTEAGVVFSLSPEISKSLNEMFVNNKLLYLHLDIDTTDFSLDYTCLMNRQSELNSIYYFVSVNHVDIFITKRPTEMWELALAFTD